MFIVLLIAIMVGYVVLHYRASYTLPFPWPDEAHFLWQADGFAEHFSLFAPELNSERTIFWMPPGYLMALGAVIKLFGLSLEVARTFSMLLMLASIGMLALLVRRYSVPTVSLLLAVPFVLGAPFVAAGNIARMEALLILMLLAAFLFLQRGKVLVGICLLALAPLIHPNGLYFLVTGAVAAFVLSPRQRGRLPLSASEALLIAFVVLCWIGYAVYAGMHWTDFIADMKFQMTRKADRDVFNAVLSAGSISLAVIALLGAIYCYRRQLSVNFLLAIAVPAWWAAAAGIEMWYRIFFSLSYFLLAVIFLSIAIDLARANASRWKNAVSSVLVVLIAGGVIGWNVTTSSFGEPLVFPDSKPWYNMTPGGNAYITGDDIHKIRSVIERLAQYKAESIVEFYPAADAFYYTSPIRPRIRFSCPLFGERQADWYIVHLSDRFTPTFNKSALELFDTVQVGAADLPQYFIHSGANGDQWFLIPGVGNTTFRGKH